MKETEPLCGARAQTRQRRQNKILETSLSLLGMQDFESVSMEQLANAAEIGSATIYRYFPTKNSLVLAVALYAWEKVIDQYMPQLQTEAYEAATGKEQLSAILEIFLMLYQENTTFLRFLQVFDAYLKKGCLSASQLSEYEELISRLKNRAILALEQGQSDGSLHFAASADTVYFTIFHSMLSTTQKLALQGDLLSMNGSVSGMAQLQLLKDLLLRGLS